MLKLHLPTKAMQACVEGVYGCYSTGKTCLNITVLKLPKVFKEVRICPNVNAFEDTTFVGGPFPPGVPCGSFFEHSTKGTNAEGCTYEVSLKVASSV